MDNFPNKNFTSEGYWKDQKGNTGKYMAELKLQDNKFNMKLVFEDGEAVEKAGEIKFSENGFLQVLEDRKAVGHGYCGSIWCHITTQDPEIGLMEETMVFVDNQIFHLGSATYNGVKFFWEDALTRVTK